MLNIIPKPFKALEREGKADARGGYEIFAPEKCERDTLRFYSYFPEGKGAKLKVNVTLDDSLARESYLLDISDGAISIAAGNSAGYAYALESLRQLHVAGGGLLPCALIEDKPRFSHRGFMLDVGRYFMPLDEVKKFVDFMLMHKLNVFHLHLTEDQGWRVEIKKYPLLTKLGSRRSHTNFGIRPHGGFYTQAQLKELVSYCHERHIAVIPEIDMPGHMQAAIHCYPQLSCFDRKLPVATHWGVKHDILCAGKDFSLQFVCDVLDEIVEIFPDGFVHLGGDEAPKMRWKLCPHCQKRIKDLGLKDENQLQAHFISQVKDHLKLKGVRAMTWNEDEISGKAPVDVAWTIWNVTEKELHKMYAEMERGREIVNCSSVPNYLDLTYNKCPLKAVYTQPVDICKPHPLMKGAEASLWTEQVPNIRRAHFKTFPRLGAFAEAVWTPDLMRNYDEFLARIPAYVRLLKANGVKKVTGVKRANPGKVFGFFEQLWFEKVQLCWHGLHNLIDDAKVAKLAKKRRDKKE